jgi:ABC-type bacteriocin/lantibiotic exporter with double-glycine peptidase domain
LRDGGYALALRRDNDGGVLIGDPRLPRPQRLDQQEVEAIWSGKLLLVKSRLRLDNPNRPFDLSWFVPAIWKYRKILWEILAASFVIQLFGLATPLFTQVIIDEVLMHKSLSTLHVLAVGMLIMIVFEAILTILKTHLLAHTSNRIDVALGARLFRHLLHIPLRYFELRRVGDTVARVRELEGIRQFLTGSSINVVLDLIFTVLFMGLSIRRLGDLLNTKAEPVLHPGKTSLPPIAGAVRLESVRFRYQFDGPEILRNLCIDIAPGTTVGVVGRSGSGKSTLAKLLQRLSLPESGRILIDGVDLQQSDPAWLRRQIGIVMQENFLFNGSIRDNIAIHLPGAPMEQIVEMAKLAGAHDFILQMPEAYDTPVGERGTALSGGQRQRIAIARALMANPRILIFDEATSALDYESERIIQDNLGRICKGRTVFIIAHRLSTIRQADTILVLDRGELVEQGSHSELIARAGLYHHLFSQQLGGVAHAVA